MSDQTVEDLLGPPPRKKAQPSVEDLLGPKPSTRPQGAMTGTIWDQEFMYGGLSEMGHAFTKEFSEQFGIPTGMDTKSRNPDGTLGKSPAEGLREIGVFNDYTKGESNIYKGMLEEVLRPSIYAADAAMRGVYATARALVAAGFPLSPFGAAASAMLEGAGAEFAPAGSARVGAKLIQRDLLRKAQDLGVADERKPIQPNEGVPKQTEEFGPPAPPGHVIAGETPETPLLTTEPQTVHDVMRVQNPELMAERDNLSERQGALRDQLQILTESEAKPFQDQIDTILGKVAGVESRLTKTAAQRLEDARHNLAYTLATDSPERREIRKQLNDTNNDIARQGPEINAAYEQAKASMPEPPEVIAKGVESTDPVNAPPIWQELGLADKPEEVRGGTGELAQRRATIARTVSDSLVQAGRPLEEANALGTLVQSHFAARAERLGVDTRQLFDNEFPQVQAGDIPHKGVYNWANNVLTLGKDADASTFVHELGHNWLEEMLRDAKDPRAVQGLRDDFETVKQWLGMEGDTPTRKEHETFARGFERYMREGIAPSTRLAGVFAKFKDWLTQIYQNLSRLRAPINDDIRGIYDRLLAPKRDIMIADDLITRNIGDLHEADTKATSSEGALERADLMRAERDATSSMLSPEINNARRRARESGGGAETGTERTGVSEPSGVEPGGEPGRTENAPESAEIGPSGSSFKAKSTSADRPDSRVVASDGTVRLANIESPEDVDAAIRGSSGGGGGVATPGQVQDIAYALGQRAGSLDTAGMREAWTAADFESMKRLLDQSAMAVRDAMISAAESGDALELAQAIMRHEMIQGKIKGATSEWGRAGAAIKQLYTAAGGKGEAIDVLLRQNTGRGYDQLMQMAQLAQNLKGSNLTHSMSKFIQITSAGQAARAMAYYYAQSLLSGPITHSVYAVSNNVRALSVLADVSAQAAWGSTRELFGATPAERVYWQEVGSAFYGLGAGTKDGIQPALDAYKSGHQLPLPGQRTSGNPWNAFYTPNPKVEMTLGQPGKIVAGIHQFSRVQFFTMHLYRDIMRQALSEGLQGAALENRIADLHQNTPQDMLRAAADKADTDMFQRKSQFGGLESAMSHFVNSHPMARLLFPFVKIGVEIQRETLKYIPVAGMVLSETRGDLLGRNGGARFDEAMGKQTIGFGLMAAGATLAANGVINDYGPTEPDQRKDWLLTHIPYSVNIAGLQIPFQGLGPQGKLLQLSADLWKVKDYWNQDESKSLAKGYFKSVARAMLDESFFRDTTDLFQAIDNPTEHGVRWLGNWAAGFVPGSSLLSQVNRAAFDPYSKEIGPEIGNVIDAIKARIPVASWSVPNQVDIFGNEVPARGGILSTSMYTADRYANDPTAKWLNNLGIGPGRLDRSIANVRLTEKQYHDMEVSAGHLTKLYFDNAVQHGIEQTSRAHQIKEMHRMVAQARHQARTLLKIESLGGDDDLVMKAMKHKEELNAR